MASQLQKTFEWNIFLCYFFLVQEKFPISSPLSIIPLASLSILMDVILFTRLGVKFISSH